MIENLETLVALSKVGTMMEASTELRISQSAVSKRIATLERYYDRELIERHGRRVVLTHHGTRLVERVTPLLTVMILLRNCTEPAPTAGPRSPRESLAVALPPLTPIRPSVLTASRI